MKSDSDSMQQQLEQQQQQHLQQNQEQPECALRDGLNCKACSNCGSSGYVSEENNHPMSARENDKVLDHFSWNVVSNIINHC